MREKGGGGTAEIGNT